jgi:capsule polysaccharide export protein KpsC/LpsZ
MSKLVREVRRVGRQAQRVYEDVEDVVTGKQINKITEAQREQQAAQESEQATMEAEAAREEGILTGRAAKAVASRRRARRLGRRSLLSPSRLGVAQPQETKRTLG